MDNLYYSSPKVKAEESPYGLSVKYVPDCSESLTNYGKAPDSLKKLAIKRQKKIIYQFVT